VKIKLDEHLGSVRVVTWLRLAGHDVATVREQGLTSTPDEELIEICTSEGMCLVTNDRGFGNRLKYNPANYAGIIVIRLPPHHNFDDLRVAIDTLIMGVEEAEVTGKLWLIQSGSIQEYQPIEPDV
jgi:predicted nuclease of predicted toxin-antitoxin system